MYLDKRAIIINAIGGKTTDNKNMYKIITL